MDNMAIGQTDGQALLGAVPLQFEAFFTAKLLINKILIAPA